MGSSIIYLLEIPNLILIYSVNMYINIHRVNFYVSLPARILREVFDKVIHADKKAQDFNFVITFASFMKRIIGEHSDGDVEIVCINNLYFQLGFDKYHHVGLNMALPFSRCYPLRKLLTECHHENHLYHLYMLLTL